MKLDAFFFGVIPTAESLDLHDVAVKKSEIEVNEILMRLFFDIAVQGYQEAMLAAEKLGQKVIYGLEAYFVNDTAGVISGDYSGSFEDEMIVFDIETTGMSNQNDKIIEIGAVKIKGGEVLERYNTFVNGFLPVADISM